MKKFAISLFVMLSFYLPTYCQNFTTIDKIENSIFGMTYPEQNNKDRIERLEKNIYGGIQNGNLNTRLEKIAKDISAETIGEEITPQKYTDYEDDIEDNSVDYPIINELEKKVFNREFKSKNLDMRLTDLEKKVFNKTYKDDFNTRTNRLKSAIQVQSSSPKTDYNDDFEYKSDMEKFALGYPQEEYSSNINTTNNIKKDKNVVKILNALEKKLLKKTYPNEQEEARIERLEEKMFNTSFPQDSIESRLERLALAYQGTKSSKKYDTNKLSQHMATAMQVGMFLLMILAMVL